MTIKPATVDDILEMMDRNKREFADFALLPDEQKRNLAQLNIDSGLAQSYFLDDKLVAVGGIRMIGLGEAWLAVDPDIKTTHKKTLMRESKTLLDDAKSQGIWCLFAVNKISENFLRHLGFEKKTMYMRIK